MVRGARGKFLRRLSLSIVSNPEEAAMLVAGTNPGDIVIHAINEKTSARLIF
jgi:hypothetical protein